MNEADWLSLREAAALMGVHPATVRKWANDGDIPSRRTPGGHRRFLRRDLLRHAKTSTDWQPLEVQVILQNALGQTRMNVGGGNLSQLTWYESLSDTSRTQLRTEGLLTLEGMRRYLSSGAPDSQLSDAINAGKRYAMLLSNDGLSLPDAVRGFLYFSDFVLNSVLTWSEITPARDSVAEWGTLIRRVNTFIHAVLLSIIEYYEPE